MEKNRKRDRIKGVDGIIQRRIRLKNQEKKEKQEQQQKKKKEQKF